MTYLQIFLVVASSSLVLGQRPFFAGLRPIGYPEIEKPSTVATELDNRFGEGTTQRLPVEANGDRELVDRLSKLPIDKQPFWFINWQAIEAHRQKPQSYPLRPNPFAETPVANAGPVPTQSDSATSNLGNRGGDLNTKNSEVSNTKNGEVGNTFSTTSTRSSKSPVKPNYESGDKQSVYSTVKTSEKNSKQ